MPNMCLMYIITYVMHMSTHGTHGWGVLTWAISIGIQAGCRGQPSVAICKLASLQMEGTFTSNM